VRQVNLNQFLSSFFGPYAVPAWNQLGPIAAATKHQTYTFMDLPIYQNLVRHKPEEAQAVYWREMILRIHLASCAALRRHGEWLRSVVMAVEKDCLFGAFASYRGFLESAADSFYSVGPVPKTIAPNLRTILRCLEQKPMNKTVFAAPELEQRLIHFSHGRKLQRGENADPIHAAKQLRDYLDGLEREAGVSDVHEIYSELCGITHPSAESVVLWYEAERKAHNTIWREHTLPAMSRFNAFLDRWRAATEIIVNAAFVPTFMSLRILHKFDFLPRIPHLRSFPLDTFAVWKKIERQISR
jgi:hypothetical protein